MEKFVEWQNKLKDRMERKKEKASLINLGTMLVNLVILTASRSVSSALAEYEGTDFLYYLSWIVFVIIVLISIWEFICLIYDIGRKAKEKALIFFYFLKRNKAIAAIAGLSFFVLVGAVCIFSYNKCDTAYYASVVEIYGIPNGVGELSQEEREGRSGYWRIDDYTNRKEIVLTYVDSYQQMEIMRQHSSLYGMSVFDTPARIECAYSVEREKFRSYGKEAFLIAEENGYRVPKRISYYSSNGKLLLELHRSGEENKFEFEIEAYSSKDAPQLLNSTLLRIPEGNEARSGVIQQRVETTYDLKGRPVMRRFGLGVHSPYGVNGERYTYDEENRMTTLCYFGVDGEPMRNKSGIMLIAFRYDADGRLESVRYYSDKDGTERTEGFYGVFCEKFFYEDQFGNLTMRRQLDRTESRTYDVNGGYEYEYEYSEAKDHRSILSRECFLGVDGREVFIPKFGSSALSYHMEERADGALIRISFDGLNQSSEFAEFDKINLQSSDSVDESAKGDEAGQAPKDSEPGQWGVGEAKNENLSRQAYVGRKAGAEEWQSDSEGELEERREYDTIEYLCGDKKLEKSYSTLNEQGCAKIMEEYDERMRLKKVSYLNMDGEPCLTQDGYAAIRYTYDPEEEYKTYSEEYLDTNNNWTVNLDVGYASVIYERTYKGKNEVLRKEYYDSEKKKVPASKNGYFTEEMYDRNGRLIWQRYQDEDGNLTCRDDFGVAKIEYIYADEGNLKSKCYRGIDGRGMVSRQDVGIAEVRKEYDACGNQTEESYYDEEGELTVLKGYGYASWKAVYENGKCVEAIYRDTTGNPVLRNDTGYASEKLEYDRWGRMKKRLFYGVDGQPVISAEHHCAAIEEEYDEKGNKVKVLYKGLDGETINRDDMGVAEVHKEYDSYGRQIKELYYDEKGNPAIRKEYGYASREEVYEKGRCVEIKYYDAMGNPVLHKDKGYASEKIEYDEQGRQIRYLFCGVNDQPMFIEKYGLAEMEVEYDKKGNETVIRYKGLNGEAVNNIETGIAEIRKGYDAYGNQTEESYYDEKGDPVIHKEYGYASREDVYETGRRIEIIYKDEKGNPMLHKDKGYASEKIEYDEQGRMKKYLFYDVDGQPMIIEESGIAAVEMEYDKKGNEVTKLYKGLNGEAVNSIDTGIAEIRKEYDAYGNKTRESYYDDKGEPALHEKYGYASKEEMYGNGKIVERKYYDTTGGLALRKDTGFAIEKTEYDEYGRRTKHLFYGADGQPIISTKYGYAAIEYEYDNKGNEVRILYKGPDGEAMNAIGFGIAEIRKEYDAYGNQTGESRYDVEGNQVNDKGI